MEPPKVIKVMKKNSGGIITKINVTPSDKLSDAVKRMLFHNASRVTVVQDGRSVGLLELKDALKELGL